MPTVAEDPQQIQKKRHVGNDFVHIIWCEHIRDYNPLTITSRFNEAHIVIYPEPSGLFRIQVFRNIVNPLFGPAQHGMLVCKRLLPKIVRETAINADVSVSSQFNPESFSQPYMQRKRLLGETHSRLRAPPSSQGFFRYNAMLFGQQTVLQPTAATSAGSNSPTPGTLPNPLPGPPSTAAPTPASVRASAQIVLPPGRAPVPMAARPMTMPPGTTMPLQMSSLPPPSVPAPQMPPPPQSLPPSSLPPSSLPSSSGPALSSFICISPVSKPVSLPDQQTIPPPNTQGEITQPEPAPPGFLPSSVLSPPLLVPTAGQGSLSASGSPATRPASVMTMNSSSDSSFRTQSVNDYTIPPPSVAGLPQSSSPTPGDTPALIPPPASLPPPVVSAQSSGNVSLSLQDELHQQQLLLEQQQQQIQQMQLQFQFPQQ